MGAPSKKRDVFFLISVNLFLDVLSENITDEEPLPLSSAKSLYSSCMDTGKFIHISRNVNLHKRFFQFFNIFFRNAFNDFI